MLQKGPQSILLLVIDYLASKLGFDLILFGSSHFSTSTSRTQVTQCLPSQHNLSFAPCNEANEFYPRQRKNQCTVTYLQARICAITPQKNVTQG